MRTITVRRIYVRHSSKTTILRFSVITDTNNPDFKRRNLESNCIKQCPHFFRVKKGNSANIGKPVKNHNS